VPNERRQNIGASHEKVGQNCMDDKVKAVLALEVEAA
jgi:hypothetical protein